MVWLAVVGRLSAQDRLDAPIAGPLPAKTRDADSVWFDENPEPLPRQFVAPGDLPLVDDQPPVGSTGGASLNTAAVGDRGRSPFAVRAWWMPQQNLRNYPGDLTMNGQEVELAFPYRIDPEGIWLALSSVKRLEIGTSAEFSDSGLRLPDQLWDIEIGTMHIREWADGRRAGGMLRVGSPSDQPFAALRDMTVTLLGFLTIPRGERDAWSFSLFYSPTGQIIFPIPGIAYVWRPNRQFQANLGIPFSLEYRPTETMTLTASYLPLNQVQVLARQSLGESWSIYGGYRVVNQTFLLADRLDSRERTYVFDQRLTLGVQRELNGGWRLDFSTGYAFDRQIFQAEKFSGRRNGELVIDPGVVGTLQLVWNR